MMVIVGSWLVARERMDAQRFLRFLVGVFLSPSFDHCACMREYGKHNILWSIDTRVSRAPRWSIWFNSLWIMRSKNREPDLPAFFGPLST